MSDTLEKPADPAQAARSRPLLRSGLRVLLAVVAIVTVAVGGPIAYHRHAWHQEQRAQRLDKIRHLRDGVIAQAAGRVFYAPETWGAREYPGDARGDRIGARGAYRRVELSLWRVSAEEIATSPNFSTSTVASPETLCRDRPAVRALYRKGGIDRSRTRCIPIPGHHGTIRVGPLPEAVELSVEMPDGDYLSVWAVDSENTIIRDPAAWATDFVDHLAPYDLTGYSVEDLYRADAAFWS